MAKADSGAQKMLAEVQALKEEVVNLKSSNEKRFGEIEKMCRDIMAALTEISDTNAKILTSRPAGGSKSSAARKTAAPSYVDADGKMKSSSEWFKCIWVSDPEGTAAKYISKKQLEALAEFNKTSKQSLLPADKKLKEQAVFLWNTFVRKASEKADDTLRKKIIDGYSKVCAEVEAKKKSSTASGAATEEEEVAEGEGEEGAEGEEEGAGDA